MNWPFAIFGCFAVSVICSFAFFLIVYFKEYKREEKVVQELMKTRERQEKDFANLAGQFVIMAPPKKKVAVSEKIISEKTDKNKKDIN